MPNATSLHSDDLDILRALERKVLWLAAWTIHNANHLRENTDGLKVGGHQASSASLAAPSSARASGKKKYQPQTPAMALRLTDSIWSVRKLLLTPVFSTSGRG